jgi:hypothetical protein
MLIIDCNVPDNNKYYRDLDQPCQSSFEKKVLNLILFFQTATEATEAESQVSMT